MSIIHFPECFFLHPQISYTSQPLMHAIIKYINNMIDAPNNHDIYSHGPTNSSVECRFPFMLNLTLVMTTVRQVYLWVTNYNPSEKIPLSSYDKESKHIRYPPPPSPSFAPQCRTIFTSEHSTASVVWYPYDVFRPFSCTERRHFGWTGGNISTIKTRTIKKKLALPWASKRTKV